LSNRRFRKPHSSPVSPIGEERYHHKHPFHLLMHEGRLTRGQLQAWALNRYYYQSRIPIKDAAILARSEDPPSAWRGANASSITMATVQNPGNREMAAPRRSHRSAARTSTHGDGILPATRYAVQAYVDFVSTRSHLEAVASSLTELFSKKLITLRIDGFANTTRGSPAASTTSPAASRKPPKTPNSRLPGRAHARTREHQALRMPPCVPSATSSGQLDALYFAYVNPAGPTRRLSAGEDILKDSNDA